jgi:hypothetical protein
MPSFLFPCVRPGCAAEANHGPAAEDRDVHGGSLPGLGRHLHELGRLHQASVSVSQNQGHCQRYVNHKKFVKTCATNLFSTSKNTLVSVTPGWSTVDNI